MKLGIVWFTYCPGFPVGYRRTTAERQGASTVPRLEARRRRAWAARPVGRSRPTPASTCRRLRGSAMWAGKWKLRNPSCAWRRLHSKQRHPAFGSACAV